MFDTFGNTVRIKSNPETKSKGFAGKKGEIYGHTTPSMAGVEIIGKTDKDFAVNVFFSDLYESFWFAEDLIEQIDNGVGAVITLDGVDKKWTKDETGDWIEENTQTKNKNKWWKFW